MNRREWLDERRATVRKQYDAESSEYDTVGGDYPTPLHGTFIDRLLATCPPDGRVLDAACGAGKWFTRVAESGRRVVGVDQSGGMLRQAASKGVAEMTAQVGLQELSFVAEFDAAMVVDAMENVGPEDWPVALANLRRALRPGGHLFLTLEEQDDADVAAAYEQLSAAGIPAVLGEVIEGDSAGYHYYPGRERALAWIIEAGFEVVAEDFDQQPGWGYRHLLLRANRT
jgi:ubiquinone/menaquinone biosynthesis C-methylase UbiE